MSIAQLRRSYHRTIFSRIMAMPDGIPNIADKGSRTSKQIATQLVQQIGLPVSDALRPGKGQAHYSNRRRANSLRHPLAC